MVTKYDNGQIVVKQGKLTLTHTDLPGMKFNDCTIDHGDHFELISSHDERIEPLFIELCNYKRDQLFN